MTKNIYLITGPSGAGKTTIARELEQRYGFRTVSSFTDRPRRTDDEDGHIFLTTKEFDELQDLVAYTEFDGNRYGVTHSQIAEASLYVVDIKGVADIKEYYEGKREVVVLGLIHDETTLRQRMKRRGDKQQQIERRIAHDRSAFSLAHQVVNHLIRNSNKEQTILLMRGVIEYHERATQNEEMEGK